MYDEKPAEPPEQPDSNDPLKAEMDAFNANLTKEQRQQVWPFLVEFAKLWKTTG